MIKKLIIGIFLFAIAGGIFFTLKFSNSDYSATPYKVPQFNSESDIHSCDKVKGYTDQGDYKNENKDTCLFFLGLATMNIDVCKQLKAWDLQYRCITPIAQKLKDPKLCELIDPASKERFHYISLCKNASK
jgi:hypothetical protein